MKKPLVLRGLLAAATLSLGSMALAGSAGATNLTVGMYVGTNADDAYGTFYNQGALTITGGRFVNNVAYRGGAIHSDNGSLSIDGSEFSGNVANYDNGGAI